MPEMDGDRGSRTTGSRFFLLRFCSLNGEYRMGCGIIQECGQQLRGIMSHHMSWLYWRQRLGSIAAKPPSTELGGRFRKIGDLGRVGIQYCELAGLW